LLTENCKLITENSISVFTIYDIIFKIPSFSQKYFLYYRTFFPYFEIIKNPSPLPSKGEGLPCVVEEITAQGKGEGEFS
jgi:hypothetical protein